MWEYNIFKINIPFTDVEGLKHFLNGTGDAGWELVQVFETGRFEKIFILKREAKRMSESIHLKDDDVPFPKF